jgi:hypothetical protein
MSNPRLSCEDLLVTSGGVDEGRRGAELEECLTVDRARH